MERMSPVRKRQALNNLASPGWKRVTRLIWGGALCVATALFGLFPVGAQTTQQRGSEAPTPEGRDPFRPLIQKKGAGQSKEEVALSRLKLVGILWDRDGQARALVETEDGLGYILREKDSIMGGQVVEITAEAVKFAIQDTGQQGRGRPRVVSISLHSKE